MKPAEIIKELEASRDRSAWDKGVTVYALELIEEVADYVDDLDRENCKAVLLNGAADWKQYSYGACSLIYDEDIARRVCTPSELKRKRNGALEPNSRETWLDVQARALCQAYKRIADVIRYANRNA